MKKTAGPKTKLTLAEVLSLVDSGERAAWDEMTDEERSSVNFWIMNRYASSVSGSRADQENAIIKTNEFYNKNFYNINSSKNSGHQKLLWHLLCMCGDTNKKEFHAWIPHTAVSDKNNKKAVELVMRVFPNMKMDEVNLYVKLATDGQLRELAEEHNIIGF